MRQPKGKTEYGKEGCCPEDWNHTPRMTGDYVMDGSIQRCHNGDAKKRLEDHICDDNIYQGNTGYKRGGTNY